MTKHWTEAKIPVWVKESIQSDILENKRRAALAWPTEAKPEPAFSIGGYGRGQPIEGVFYKAPNGNGSDIRYRIEAAKYTISVHSSTVKFVGPNGAAAMHSKPQGQFFEKESDALLWAHWEACEYRAEDLLRIIELRTKTEAE